MDFIYAPPPPPPSKKKNTKSPEPTNPNEKSRSHQTQSQNQINNKKPRIQKPKQNEPTSFFSTSRAPFDSTGSMSLNLPTHLPNDVPSSEPVAISNSVIVDDDDIEDEELQGRNQIQTTTSAEPVFIQGTTITLQSEEDIKKWIEERRKKWPTRKNVEVKQEEQAKEKEAAAQNPKRSKPEDGDTNENSKKKPKNICKFFQQNKQCKFGKKCKNIHEASNGTNQVTVSNEHDSTHIRRQINGIPVLIPKMYSKRQVMSKSSNTSSLFKNLVQKEHYENENSIVLDFVRYLDKEGLINHDVMKDKK